MKFDIYHPEEDSYLLAVAVEKYATGSVLDIGTGSGIQAMTAAKKKEVKKVLAVDINPEAVSYVKQQIKEHKIKKLTVKKSDLFSKIPKTARFDTIIFNPPYLPRDKRETGGIATANSGGKHGYELLVRFINGANKHLNEDGQILAVFSNLTKQMKIDEAIKKNLLISEKISEKSFFMEKLIVYRIRKSSMLRTLEKNKVSELIFFSEGKRGNIFLGRLKRKKVIVKTKKAATFAEAMIDKEVLWLRTINKMFPKQKISPKFYFGDSEVCIMEYLQGELVMDYFRTASKAKIKEAIQKMLRKLYLLDQKNLNKEEMHHPVKHIIIRDDEPYLIDFERMHFVREGNAKNINQFLIFLSSREVSKLLNEKGFDVDRRNFIQIAKDYHAGKLEFRSLVKHIF